MILYIIRTYAIFDMRLKSCARIIFEVWQLNNRTDFLKRFVRYQLYGGLYINPNIFPSAISTQLHLNCLLYKTVLEVLLC